jgi:hypothetical protein
VSESARLGALARSARRLVITGFLESQALMVGEGLERLGYSIVGRARENGWLLLSFAPKGRARSQRRAQGPRSVATTRPRPRER